MSETPTLEFIAFCLQSMAGVGPARLRSILSRMAHEQVTPEAFTQLDDRALAEYRLDSSVTELLRDPPKETMAAWRQLLEKNIHVLALGNTSYPHALVARIGDHAPPLLFAQGNQDLLRLSAVGFCGSRRASQRGLDVARECSRLIALEGINIISGYAHGVDMAAHGAALVAGGTTTLVLAEGILQFRLKSDLREAMTGDLSRVLIVSEFPPTLPWRAHSAMARNSTICGLSNAMVIVEAGKTGGTFEAGKTALRLGVPLFCVEFAEPAASAEGNPYFLERGAHSLRRARSGVPNVSDLVSVARSGHIGSPRQNQLLLREESSPQ